MNRYEDFWNVTESALVATCNAMKLHLEAESRAELMKAYLSLKPFPEVKQTLSALSKIPKAILSNGNPKMLEDVVKNAGLEDAFSQLISVDDVKIYKPSPAVYRLAVKKMGCNAESIGFVSSNFFDVAGAKVFGFRTYWVNRSNIPGEELGVTPDAILKSLGDLIELVKS